MPSSDKILPVYSEPFSRKFGVKFLPKGPRECIYLSTGRTVEDSKSATVDSYWEVVCELSNGAKIDSLARFLP
jgi:hypothetical protein